MNTEHNNTAELHLAVFQVTFWTQDKLGKEHYGKLELVAESNLEAIETITELLNDLDLQKHSFSCKRLYTLLWSFVAA